jgi:hypothetical protein
VLSCDDSASSVSRIVAVCLKCIFGESTGKTPPLHDCQEKEGLALTGCGMGKIKKNSPDKGNTNTFSAIFRILILGLFLSPQ